MEECIGCSEGRAGWCGWSTHRAVGWWEGNGQYYEALEIEGGGYGISVVRAWVCDESVAGVDPGDPHGPVHVRKKFRIKPMGELGGAAGAWVVLWSSHGVGELWSCAYVQHWAV